MTFASSWTRLQGSWFRSSVCVTCSQSIGNVITAVRLMQRYWLLRGQCNSEVGRYIKKHGPKFDLPVASHLFLLIFLPPINKRNRVLSSTKDLAGSLGRWGHCPGPWACAASFHWAKENTHKSTRPFGRLWAPFCPLPVPWESVPMVSPMTADQPGWAPPVQHHGQRPPPAAPGQGRPSASPPAPSPSSGRKAPLP